MPNSTHKKTTPGKQLVGFSHAKTYKDFAINDIDMENQFMLFNLLKIGKGAGYDRKREFEQKLLQQRHQSQDLVKQWIFEEDPAQHKTLEGGMQSLNQWYQAIFKDTA